MPQSLICIIHRFSQRFLLIFSHLLNLSHLRITTRPILSHKGATPLALEKEPAPPKIGGAGFCTVPLRSDTPHVLQEESSFGRG